MVEECSKSSSWVMEMEKLLGDFDPESEIARQSKQSIYRVPEWIKDYSHSALYRPKVVSLGPFHHGEPRLLRMEEHKRRAVLQLVKRSGRTLQHFTAAVEQVAEDLEAAYGQDLEDKWRGEKNRARFVELMVTDGCYLLELMRMFLLRGKGGEDYGHNDPVFSEHGYLYMELSIVSDVLLLENQLPLLLLQKLILVAPPNDYQLQQDEMMNNVVRAFFRLPQMAGNGIGRLGLHPLELVHRSIRGALSASRESQGLRIDSSMPGAAMLHLGGIQFMASNCDGFAGAVNFEGGTLSIPQIKVNDSTECMYLNMMAFERLHPNAGNEVMAFIVFMDKLINNAKDVELLRSKGIIFSSSGSDDEVAYMFNTILSKGAVMSTSSNLQDVLFQVHTHCISPFNICKAYIRHAYVNIMDTYGSIPGWAFLSMIGGFILLVAGVLQAFYTVLDFYRK